MKRRVLFAALWLAPTAVLLTLASVIYGTMRIDVPDRLGAGARAAAMTPLRAAVDGRSHAPPSDPELDRALAGRGPAVVTVYHRGSRIVRVLGHGDTAAAAITAAAEALAASERIAELDAAERADTTIEVDLAVGRGPIARFPEALTAVSLHPGVEGFGVTLDGDREVVLTPLDLVARGVLSSRQPIGFIPELRFGFDFERAEMMLATEARLPAGGFGSAKRDYWRFRTDSFVERPPGDRDAAPLALTRGIPPAPEATADSLRAAALAGGRYLVAHLAPTGRYVYETNLASGHSTNPKRPHPYSLPRHAGTTYFLAELYRHTGEDFLREPIERAFGHLGELVRAGGCSGTLESGAAFSCVVDKGQKVAGLGSTALTVVALAEYKRATGQGTYDELALSLTEWILSMQRPDGSFYHRYEVATETPDPDAELLYFSGEAALALARMHAVYGDPRYLDATRRALDWLVDWYDFFAGGFFYGEEHWTCIAAEAAWPALKDERYADFCRGYGAFLRRQQHQVGDFPDQDDLAGTYGFTPFFPPANTPAGSRTEAMISSYLLTAHHGDPDSAILDQIVAAMQFSLGQQVRPESAWHVPERAQGLGGVPATPIDRGVRIDYVQHVCSAMIRTAALLEER